MERPLITSFQSNDTEWTHWVRVPENRQDEFHNWLAASIPNTIAHSQHSELLNGVRHIVYRVVIKNTDHNMLLRLTWG